MGTALTENQLYLLKRFTRRIVLALDSDAAGSQATLRGLQIASQTMDREPQAVFDARGLIGYEARLQADIRVTTLPEGLDPDDVVNQDPQRWKQLLEQAQPVVIHVMQSLAAGRDLEDPKIKSEIARQVLPLIEDVVNPVERDTYRQRLARFLKVDELTLLAPGAAGRRRARPRRLAKPGAAPAEPLPQEAESLALTSNYTLEAHCLGVLLRRPDLLYQVDRELQSKELRRVTVDDFQHVDHQAIFALVQESVDQDVAEPLNFVLGSLSLPMMELADGLLARTDQLDPNDERVLEDLLRALVDLRLRQTHQNIDYLRILMFEAQEKGDMKASEYRQSMVQHTKDLQRLNRAREQYTSRSYSSARERDRHA